MVQLPLLYYIPGTWYDVFLKKKLYDVLHGCIMYDVIRLNPKESKRHCSGANVQLQYLSILQSSTVVAHIQRIGCQPEKNYFTRWPIPLAVC